MPEQSTAEILPLPEQLPCNDLDEMIFQGESWLESDR